MIKPSTLALTAAAVGVGISGAAVTSAHLGGFGMPGEQVTKEQRQQLHEQRASDTAAVLGVSIDDLKAARQAGTRLPNYIEQLGLNGDDVKASLRAKHGERVKAHLDELVASGKLSQEEADERYQKFQSRPDRPHGPHRGPRGGQQAQ